MVLLGELLLERVGALESDEQLVDEANVSEPPHSHDTRDCDDGATAAVDDDRVTRVFTSLDKDGTHLFNTNLQYQIPTAVCMNVVTTSWGNPPVDNSST